MTKPLKPDVHLISILKSKHKFERETWLPRQSHQEFEIGIIDPLDGE